MANQGKINCTFPNCFEYFDNAKSMKKHKKYSDMHDYCHICDEDFLDYETWTAHNALWSGKDTFGITQRQYARQKKDGSFDNEKSKYGPKYGESKFHQYGCKFCGVKFRTESGRQHHTNEVRVLFVLPLLIG